MFHKICRRIVFPLYKLVYRPKIKGLENLPRSGGYLIISNHLGKIDCFAIATLFREKIYFMAKKEWFTNKIKAKFFGWLGGIPVDRDHVDVMAIKKCFETLKRGDRLVVFPEGTRNKTQEVDLLPIKGGANLIAYKAKVKIVPIAMKSRFRIFRKNYMYIGEPFDYSEYGGQKLTDELNKQLTKEMAEKLQFAMDEVKVFATEKK